MCDHIFLIGFMGTGKTTAGSKAARLAGCFWCDLDDLIVRRIGMSIADYMERYGEEAFRDAESDTLAGFIESGKDTDGMRILSCGGGVILRSENRALLRENGTVIRLTSDPDTICARVLADEPVRPLLSAEGSEGEKALRERIDALISEREELYRRTAHHEIDTDQMSADEVARRILRLAGV